MIFPTVGDLERAVKLFQQHHPRHLVRKGHFGHGKPKIGLLFEFIRQPERTAEYEYKIAGAVYGKGRYFLTKLFARHLFALNAH